MVNGLRLICPVSDQWLLKELYNNSLRFTPIHMYIDTHGGSIVPKDKFCEKSVI